MIRGIYTAAAGMMATLTANDTLANNLANVDTTGFKKNAVSFQTFPQMLIHKMSAGQDQEIGGLMSGSKVYDTNVRFEQGQMIPTNNTFDMAIQGNGFFTLKDNAGNLYYTRAGNFTVNQDGYLVSSQGYFLQGKLGNMQIKLDQAPYHLSEDGTLSGGGRSIDQLKIARFDDQNMLVKTGDTLFQAGNAQLQPDPATGEKTDYSVEQGMLERSNTNVVAELVNSIQGQRLYETLDKNIKLQNEMTDKAVNDVGAPK